MVFSSVTFIFVFLPITLFGYFFIKKKYRNYWLLFVSVIFFSWSQLGYSWIIILNIAINYCGAMLISKFIKSKKAILIVCIFMNLGLLFYYKYYNFAIESINELFNCFISLRNITLPIGISFFTFQGISYIIDVYRGDVPAQKNLFKVALYIMLFPQLIAGPIVRYKDIEREIDSRTTSLNDFSDGIERFIIGISKKAIISNTMAVLVDNVWAQGANCNQVSLAWITSIAYTFQIYFDFSGYSDMAIGLGRMLGFHFNENFNLPYTSESISEFWRRWHISLSSWFRDYVYIPLGGNQKRVYFNLAIVFILTGIWHGASWHFIAWGVWNGIFILLERYFKNKKKRAEENINNKQKWMKKWIKKFYTLLVINFGWILFRAPGNKEASQFILSMFGIADTSRVGYKLFWYLDRWTLTIMTVAVFFSTSLPLNIVCLLEKKLNLKTIIVMKYIGLIFLFYLSLLRIVSGTYNPFIYFQF